MAATEVSLDMGKELRMHNNPSSTDKMDQITVDPIPYESERCLIPEGFCQFFGTGYLDLGIATDLDIGHRNVGEERHGKKNRFHSLVPILQAF